MRYLPFYLSLLLPLLTQCGKKDPAPQLPPETTIGANTAGCRVEGKILVPRNKWPTGGLTLAYGFARAGRAALSFGIVDAQDPEYPLVRIEMDKAILQEGRTYRFGTQKGDPRAIYFGTAGDYRKQDADPGELTITRLDSAQHIIAGRFYFVGTLTTGQQVRVTEGRFDFR